MANAKVNREVDVYLSKQLHDKLLLLQYPTRPSDRANVGSDVLCAKIKPKQQKVQIEMGINTRSRNYDHSKAEQIALNTDGPNADVSSSETFFNSSRMDKHVLTSSKTFLPSGCYLVGRFHEGRLHLCPINSMLKMHSSFEYIDKAYALGHKEDGGTAGDAEEGEEEAQAVTVKFAGPNAEKAKKAREKAFNYLQKKNQAEPWTSAKYHAIGSPQSKLEYQKLLCKTTRSESSNLIRNDKSHIQILVPECFVQSDTSVASTANSDPSAQLSSLSEQLRSMMLSSHMLQFSRIMDFMPKDQLPNVEKVLQQIALLVRGCWVVKSDILYNKDTTSPLNGISAEILTRARDYILWYFTKNKYVTRTEILSVIKIPNEDVTALLSQVAKKVYNKGWEFKYPFDDDFVDNHPNIVQRQEMLWDVRYKQLVRDLRLGQMSTTETSPKKYFPPPPSPKERHHFKYRECFSGDDAEESGAESSSSDKMDVDNGKKGRSLKRTLSGSNRKRSVHSPVKNDPRTRHLSANAFDLPSSFLSSLPSQEVKTELVNHVKDMVYEKFCLTVDELRDSLNEASLGYLAQREDCHHLLEEVLVEIGAHKVKNKWPQNTQPATLYAFTKFGTNLDRYRESLLDLFTNVARSRPNFLIKKIEDENGEIVSENICRQIFEEYCLYKAGYYYLKGTITADT